ncbi:amidohydrolase [Microbacterium sp. C7(2022)]|uniref:amidohydrolase n=1 Tax=Microbacterium sp. C7(2022) TaxID=2992759 RepID=UPI00237BAEB6|nr:amidohydrolase [Microbacterium sp. C7(2022)]MDE0547642.1 amidohydrolase [Microbacterium sp. C7(2022)]
MTAPQLILTGGTVITVDDADTLAEAIAVTDGLISAVGTAAEVGALADDTTRVIDLDGKTVIPGFVDAHSHVSMGAPYIKHAALQPAPTGDVHTVDDIVRKLHEAKERNNPAPGEYVIGWGYYPEEMDDDGAVTADLLDREFPDHKVVVVHISGHGGVANTRVLEAAGFVDGVADPDGGTIVRYPGTEKPNGVLWEQAWMPLVFSLLDYEESAMLAMLHEYARWGMTTVQDGAATMEQVRNIRQLAESDKGIPIDVRSLVIFNELEEGIESGLVGTTSAGHTVQGTKLILDGSPQGRTARVTEEYVTGGPGGEHHWHGISVIDQETTDKVVALAYQHGIQVFAHVNGDGAIDQLLNAHRAAVASGAQAPGRTIPIHSQVMRIDQLDEYVAEGFEPSMFTVHTYLFGDTHIKNFGEKRAFGISPMRSAIDRGLRPTNHSDYPITPINPLLLLWSSVVRRSTGGVVLGEGERVTPLEGLRALTINAAYEHRCEDDRGSIEVGKLADLVVLERNLLDVEHDDIPGIPVVATFKRGKAVYEA